MLLVLLLLASASFAEPVVYGDPLDVAGGTATGWSYDDVVAGDFNGDGEVDFAGAAGPVVYVLLAGAGTYFDQIVHTFPTSTVFALQAGHFDGNQSLDIVASVGGHVWVLLNNGNAEFTASDLGVFGDTIYLRVADIDGDGVDDFVTCGRDNLRWFENKRGDATQWPSVSVDIGQAVDCKDVAVGDVNGDDDLDIAAVWHGWKLYWYESSASGFLWSPHLVQDPAYVERIQIADLDEDGDADLVGADSNEPLPWWENVDGAATNWAANTLAIGKSDWLLPLDLDNDGHLDLAIQSTVVQGDYPRDLDVYLDIAHSLNPIPFARLPRWSHFMQADIGSDGVTDLVAFTGDAVYAGNPALGVPATVLRHGVDFGLDVASADLDGDLDEDIVVAASQTPWFLNPRGYGDNWDVVWLGSGRTTGVDVGDLDGDGWIDVVVDGIPLEGAVSWYRNQGDGTWTHFAMSGNPGRGFRVIDLDDDGDLDLVGGATWVENVVGDGSSWDTHTTAATCMQGDQNWDAGDIDVDGDLDLAGFCGSPSGRLAWFDNRDGGGLVWTRTQIEENVGAAWSVAVDDVDDDLDEDIAASWRDTDGDCPTPANCPTLALWINDDAGTSWTRVLIDEVEVRKLAFKDVDGDADLDLVGLVASRLVWWDNGGDWIRRSIGDELTTTAWVAFDAENDGDIDFAALHQPNALSVWKSNRIVAPPDIDGDGIEDQDDVCPSVPDPDQVDDDSDGFGSACECNDSAAAINPDADEVAYNGDDDDCDPRTPDDDLDGDGYALVDDCDDLDHEVSPGADEVPYDAIDNDCDSGTPDDDLDRDGYDLADDCDDAAPNVSPDADEVPYDGTDNDCDPWTPDDDLDGDGYALADDCDDDDASVSPVGTEVPYNGIDEDCTSATPDDDLDGDGYPAATDCDDTQATRNPGTVETPYNNLDDDCNPETPDNDLDGDGFPSPADCADGNPAVSPGADEIPYNDVDDDCSALTPDDDLDDDGFGIAHDCDDEATDVNPDADDPCGDGLDQDCDGLDTCAGDPDTGCGCAQTKRSEWLSPWVVIAGLLAVRRRGRAPASPGRRNPLGLG